MRLSELVVWYLEQIESDISADQLDYEHTVVEKVIKKLLKTVSLCLTGTSSYLLTQYS